MNRNPTYVSTVLGALLLLGSFAQAEEETAEPLELTRLREQFQARVDQEMIPWRDKYKKELQKLEDRLIQERRLSEALAVKTERDYGGGLSSKPDESTVVTNANQPRTAADLQKYLKDTVWLTYSVDDKKFENIIAVYYFYDSGDINVYSIKTEKLKWISKSGKDVQIPCPNGDITLIFEAAKSTASVEHMGKKFTALLVGRPPKKQ